MTDIPLPEFSRDELLRYSRNILLPMMGRRGQDRLRSSRVLIVGLGGLGSPAALYLAAAGVGELLLAEDDRLELSNLGRQILYATEDVGRPKMDAALERLSALNPLVRLTPVGRLTAANGAELFARCDLALEGSDSLGTKFLANDLAYFARRPLVLGGIIRHEGQIACMLPGQSFCYRCLFGYMPPSEAVPTCAAAGVFGALAGILGSFMALETIKYLAFSPPLPEFACFRIFDGLRGELRRLEKNRNPKCPLCGPLAAITTIRAADYGETIERCAPSTDS